MEGMLTSTWQCLAKGCLKGYSIYGLLEVLICQEEMELALPGGVVLEQGEVSAQGRGAGAGWGEHDQVPDLVVVVFAPLAEPGLLIRWEPPVMT